MAMGVCPWEMMRDDWRGDDMKGWNDTDDNSDDDDADESGVECDWFCKRL